MFRTRIAVVVSFFLVLGAPYLGAEEPATLKQVTFVPQWAPQAQFAGFYVALEKGIYRKYGLSVTIIDGGPDRSPLELLKAKKADFITLWLSTGIVERSQGVPLVNIAQLVQRSATMLIAKKSSGIRTPCDINARKVSLWSGVFRVQPEAFFKKYDLSVTVIPQSYSVNLFLYDAVDVTEAMWYNEYHTILNSGYEPDELVTFFFSEHGLNFPEDGIYVLGETLERDPAACAAFVQASLEGWRYAFEHEEEALDIIVRRMEEKYLPANRVHQRWMLDRMKDLMDLDAGGAPRPGLSGEDYNRVAGLLRSQGLSQDIPDFDTFHRDPSRKR